MAATDAADDITIIILLIGEASGVPRSVASALMLEESRGDPLAVGPKGSDGSRSRGLYQISERWQADLVARYYPHPAQYFDWADPLDSAVVGLGYLAALHRRFGTWYLALCYFNFGRVVDVPEGTKAYARRIVEARAPR